MSNESNSSVLKQKTYAVSGIEYFNAKTLEEHGINLVEDLLQRKREEGSNFKSWLQKAIKDSSSNSADKADAYLQAIIDMHTSAATDSITKIDSSFPPIAPNSFVPNHRKEIETSLQPETSFTGFSVCSFTGSGQAKSKKPSDVDTVNDVLLDNSKFTLKSTSLGTTGLNFPNNQRQENPFASHRGRMFSAEASSGNKVSTSFTSGSDLVSNNEKNITSTERSTKSFNVKPHPEASSGNKVSTSFTSGSDLVSNNERNITSTERSTKSFNVKPHPDESYEFGKASTFGTKFSEGNIYSGKTLKIKNEYKSANTSITSEQEMSLTSQNTSFGFERYADLKIPSFQTVSQQQGAIHNSALSRRLGSETEKFPK